MFRLTIRPGLSLGLLEVRHAGLLWSLIERNRSRLEVWLPWVPQTNGLSDVEVFLRKATAQHADGDGFHAGIFVEDRLAGMIGLHPIDWANRRVELGYWLDLTFEGRGLVAESAAYVTSYCFREYGLDRVEIRCGDANRRSAAIPERLGFTHEGTLRGAEIIGNRRIDLRVYSKLRGE